MLKFLSCVHVYVALWEQLIWLETPTNPMMKVVNISAVAKIAHNQPGVIVVVDNTFMSSYFQVLRILRFTVLSREKLVKMCYTFTFTECNSLVTLTDL